MVRAALSSALCLALSLGGAARALDLSLPAAARQTASEDSAPDSFALPARPYADGKLPVIDVEGRVTRQAWQIPSQGLTTLQLMGPLRDQLQAAGYTMILECVDSECGGFDFRYAADILPAPAMLVDLFDYRVLTARKGEGRAASHVMILTSITSSAGYVQLVTITPEAAPNVTTAGGATQPVRTAGPEAPIATLLDRDGHAVLADLDFATGSSELTDRSYASLQALAAYLADHPDRRLALVGHTDSEGALDGNIALSRLRAQSVVDRMIDRYGTARGQLDAEGMGYLAPVASNLSPEGREANRRVEAVLLGTR